MNRAADANANVKSEGRRKSLLCQRIQDIPDTLSIGGRLRFFKQKGILFGLVFIRLKYPAVDQVDF